jgi:hypothetical protein
MWITWSTLSTRENPPRAMSSITRIKLFLIPALTIISFFMLSRHPGDKKPYAHPSYPLRILSSVHSVTGLIVVGEGTLRHNAENHNDNMLHSIRYLRASHSILGGVWIGDETRSIDSANSVDEQGTPLGDSIYSAFVLQEAARLVNSPRKGREETWENALVMYSALATRYSHSV